jgi:hypothetical protein
MMDPLVFAEGMMIDEVGVTYTINRNSYD